MGTNGFLKSFKVSGSPGWLQTHYVAEDDFELLLLLPSSSSSWDSRCTLPSPPLTGALTSMEEKGRATEAFQQRVLQSNSLER